MTFGADVDEACTDGSPSTDGGGETLPPLVSVVVTTFNHARFLAEAIESVFAQTEQNFEVVIVDDGSTDDTAGVAMRHPRARYVRQENQGLSAARNAGVRETRGRFLVFLDADDRLLPTALEAGLNSLRSNPPCAFASGCYCLIAANGSPIPGTHEDPPDRNHYHGFLRGNYVGMHATVIYQRWVFSEVGGFNPQLRAAEDYEMYLRVARRFPVVTHQTVVAQYRLHGENMSENNALMLDAVTEVLSAEKKNVAHDFAGRLALEQGLRGWRLYYADRMLRQTVAVFRSRGAWAALRGAMPFLRRAPLSALHAGIRRAPQLPRKLARRNRTRLPGIGRIRFGDLRRLDPVSREFGFDRGTPIDRYYIEKFLASHADSIAGRVLEVGGDEYTLRFGDDRVSKSDVLHVDPANPRATIVGNLERGDDLPGDAFDCIIITQTLHLVFDLRAALKTLHRMLRPGGILLLTVPGTISQMEAGRWADVWHWGFTPLSLRKLCEGHFSPAHMNIGSFGNVLVSTAFLQGIAAEELRADELDFCDSLYPLLLTVRAEKR